MAETVPVDRTRATRAMAPFLLPRRGPATEGEREALRMPRPAPRKAGDER
jgi:hypothetical protein